MAYSGGVASTLAPAPRRPDESMELLNSILREPVDPDYAAVARGGRPIARHRGAVLLVCLLTGFMIAVSGLQSARSAPVIEQERLALIERVGSAQGQVDDLHERIATAQAEVDALRSQASGQDAEVLAAEQRAALAAGTLAVTGPGLRVSITEPDPQSAVVIDQDLRQVVNGLWQAGAEAIAVNGYRLSSRTAIRQAGSAITVNYRSLTSPYRIEAIGDRRVLPVAFADSAGGRWLTYLRNNYGVDYQVTGVGTLSLAADPGLGLTEAKVLR